MEHDSQLVSSDSENEIENINTPEPESEVTNDEFDNTMNELYDNDPNLSMHSENNIEVFVTWLCVFIALWQYAFGITDTVIDILISCISIVFPELLKPSHHRYIHFINILVMTKMPTRHMFSA